MSENLTIGVLAKHSDVNVETIRYYQRRGLLKNPRNRAEGFGIPAGIGETSPLHQRAQMLGFTLEEIQGLLALDERKACSETREIAAHKLELIAQKIADLSKMKKSLARLVRSCDASAAGAPCPIIHLLADD